VISSYPLIFGILGYIDVLFYGNSSVLYCLVVDRVIAYLAPVLNGGTHELIDQLPSVLYLLRMKRSCHI
jgi:hypothetical protein